MLHEILFFRIHLMKKNEIFNRIDRYTVNLFHHLFHHITIQPCQDKLGNR